MIKREIEPELYSLEDAASLASVSKTTIQRLCAREQLPSVLIGRSRRVPRDALVTLLREGIPSPGSSRNG
jgi:excisionase family DNA binding protein